MRRIIGKGWILIFLVVWMVNCATEEISAPQLYPNKKEEPADEVDLAPRPTRTKK